MKQNWVALAVQLMQLGFLIALPLVGGLLIGLWADNSLGTKPLFLLLGTLAGIAAGSLVMYRVVAQAIVRAGEYGRPPKDDGTKHRGTDTDVNREEKD